MMKFYILLFINLLCLVLVPFFIFQFKDEIKEFFITNCLHAHSNDTAFNGIGNIHVPTIPITATELPQNCEDIQKAAHRKLENAPSGVYKIDLGSGENRIVEILQTSSHKQVYCDMLTDNGGWLVIQRRSDNDSRVDFYRSWNQYVKGFGKLEKSHWLGLDTISAITNSDKYELRIDLMGTEEEKRYAKYVSFRVANSTDLYRLHVEGYSGDAGDALLAHNGQAFSTKDEDNDSAPTEHCAIVYQGAWWYHNCHASNLNGVYGSVGYGTGINWQGWKGPHYSMKHVEMKIRTLDYEQNL